MAQEDVKLPAPTDEEMAKLKATYGKVFQLALSVDEVFYVRRVKRAEYKRIVELVSKAEPNVREDLLNEKLLETAVVWSVPKMDPAFLTDSGAGVIPTIAMQIMRLSGFVDQLSVVEM